mgnify:CR=1 FL=1
MLDVEVRGDLCGKGAYRKRFVVSSFRLCFADDDDDATTRRQRDKSDNAF